MDEKIDLYFNMTPNKQDRIGALLPLDLLQSRILLLLSF